MSLLALAACEQGRVRRPGSAPGTGGSPRHPDATVAQFDDAGNAIDTGAPAAADVGFFIDIGFQPGHDAGFPIDVGFPPPRDAGFPPARDAGFPIDVGFPPPRDAGFPVDVGFPPARDSGVRTDASSPAVEVTIASAAVTIDNSAVAPPDPITASATLDVFNPFGSAQRIEITAASLDIVIQPLQTFDMGPPHDAPPGSSQHMIRKIAGTGSMTTMAALFCTLPLPMQLTLQLSTGASVTSAVMPVCTQ